VELKLTLTHAPGARITVVSTNSLKLDMAANQDTTALIDERFYKKCPTNAAVLIDHFFRFISYVC